MRHLSKSLKETSKIAQDFLKSVKADKTAIVVALQGDLGSGKTAFTQQIGKALGIAENMHSPTFVIMKAYRLQPTTNNSQPTTNTQEPSRKSSAVSRWSHFIHIDAYRLEKDSELLHLGWDEIIKEPENLIFIEWPENVSGVIPKNSRRISFKFVDDFTREIEIHEN